MANVCTPCTGGAPAYTRSNTLPMTWAAEVHGPTFTNYMRTRSPGVTRTALVVDPPVEHREQLVVLRGFQRSK